jgi:hypothetical protein
LWVYLRKLGLPHVVQADEGLRVSRG